MTSNQTPGPWKASGEGCPEIGVYGCGYRVALMTGGEVTRNRDNARLIAAAPELYEAVAAVIAATRDYLPPGGITKEEFISRVIAATDNARMAEIMK